MKLRKLFTVLSGVVLAGTLAVGCGGGESGSGGGTLTLGNIGWDENIALSNLTKVALEEELGYDEVELTTLDVGPLFQGVGSGDLDAFQDVWMPNHQQYIDPVQENVELLDPWYEGVTAYGIAVPDYMEDIRSLADLNEAGVDQITGIEPGALFHAQIRDEVIPTYNLDLTLAESSTPAMLAELERAYANEEPIVFLGWSPHWMNAEYDFHYLEDPENAQGNFDDPSQLATLVRADLREDDPVAYAFLEAVTMTEDEMNDLQAVIQEEGPDDPTVGAAAWMEENRDVVDPWIEAGRQAQEQAQAG
ncbi:ABC-type proline/glycine betaine transport systems periplasmic component [Rubrobacter radiotolerans]|uniref:ABC-type proline/glycine betaine transport systems periplasmic component n=1 Tax=Rubrobacter radiotolerans TaxID=42256 RepID=A0A023WZY2_RUBRA|nr:glycine betaine ABC transporter substrate-binding protein [Rubrobacter radiotolerans]AHY45325.1 ABC-type proline/glycine betaine transport systems periplasmic component [Rubrobacter radiotolerans]MDX5892737.1 glycine betaine ABC transporter substrate-binding protein [Rubrobacter radiotolerans]SMC02390.1 glycine betaine/proline transport system substrate-binding protein [Rubrobacter radiotolerans DSM 5868]